MIIFAIIALVLGVLFVVKFNKIDSYLFNKDNDDDYFSFGIESLFLSIVIGAFTGGSAFLNQIFDWSIESTTIATVTMLALISYNLIVAVVFEQGTSRIIGKYLFLLLSIALGFGVGLAGSVIILCLAILGLVLYFISAATLGTGEKVQVKDEWGNKKTLTNGFGGEMRDKWGTAYKKDGDKYYKDE